MQTRENVTTSNELRIRIHTHPYIHTYIHPYIHVCVCVCVCVCVNYEYTFIRMQTPQVLKELNHGVSVDDKTVDEVRR